MTTAQIHAAGTATIDTDDYSVSAGSSLGLDAGAVPYATGSLDLPLLDESVLDDLDPRPGGVRVPVTMTMGGVPRAFDLGLRSRKVDHKAKTVTLTLASDEALLQDFAPLAVDVGARAHEASARAVVNYGLAKIGAALEPGSDDADVTAYWSVRNMLTNPSAEGSLAPWVSGGNCTLFHSTGWVGAPSGTAAVGFTAIAAGALAINCAALDARFTVAEGRTYTLSGYGRLNATAGRSLVPVIRFFDSSNWTAWADYQGAPVALSTTAWTRATHTVVAPPGAVSAILFFRVTGSTAGQIGYLDAAMFHEGEPVPYHDGDTPDTTHYVYEWDGTVRASASTRHPVIERHPDTYVWKPGVSAWEFLLGIITSVGLVLWCDELRRWRLATPENRTIVQLINVTEGNTRTGTDTLDANDPETFATGVVVHYTWRDPLGGQHEQFDTAGTPGHVVTIPMPDTPYPGPGAAGAILARRQGTGRRQDVDTITQITTTPGMTAQISLPGAPDTVGRVASVEFDLHHGFMTLGMAGLVDIIPGSIAALVGTIDGLTGTIDSL